MADQAFPAFYVLPPKGKAHKKRERKKEDRDGKRSVGTSER